MLYPEAAVERAMKRQEVICRALAGTLTWKARGSPETASWGNLAMSTGCGNAEELSAG